MGLLISGNYNTLKMDKTKWYTIDYDIYNSRRGKYCTMEGANVAQAIPETNADTIKNGKKGHNAPSSGGEDVFPSSVSVDLPDDDIVEFVNYYYKLYEHYQDTPHPNLKATQKKKVHDTLKAFVDYNTISIQELAEMAKSFFENVRDSDHNINHFATDGILEVRFYDALY